MDHEIFRSDATVLYGSIDYGQLSEDVVRWIDEWSELPSVLGSDQARSLQPR